MASLAETEQKLAATMDKLAATMDQLAESERSQNQYLKEIHRMLRTGRVPKADDDRNAAASVIPPPADP